MKIHAPIYFLGMLVLLLVEIPAYGLTGQMVSYQSGDETVEAYISAPDGPGPFPTMVIIHDQWGLNDWIKENVELFSENGYVAIAIDLYRGKTAITTEEARSLMRNIPNSRAIRDMQAVVAYLNSRPDVRYGHIGTIGWGMGGGYALTMILTVPDLDACIVNYGRLINDKDSLALINCPILGIFGENDRGIPAMSIKAFERSCTKAGKSVEIILYPGIGADFMNENDARSYNLNASKDAWNRIFSFLDQTMKS